MDTNKLLEMEFDSLYEKIRKEQVKIARQILNDNEWIIEFCNAMGSGFFTEIKDPNTEDEVEDFVDENDPRIYNFVKFMEKWDNSFHLSGDPIMIKKLEDDSLVEIFDW